MHKGGRVGSLQGLPACPEPLNLGMLQDAGSSTNCDSMCSQVWSPHPGSRLSRPKEGEKICQSIALSSPALGEGRAGLHPAALKRWTKRPAPCAHTQTHTETPPHTPTCPQAHLLPRPSQRAHTCVHTQHTHIHTPQRLFLTLHKPSAVSSLFAPPPSLSLFYFGHMARGFLIPQPETEPVPP